MSSLNTVGERIAQEIAADPAGLKSAAACARYAGLSKSAMSELIAGRSKSSTKLHLIADYLGVTPYWLSSGKGQKYPVSQTTRGPAGDEVTQYFGSGRVPVRGSVAVTADGFWLELEDVDDQDSGYLELPSPDTHAFALRVKGDAMDPAVRSGWYLLIEPNRQIQQGEYVLVKLVDGKSTIRELLWQRDGEYALQALTGGYRLTVPKEEIEQIFPVSALFPPSQRHGRLNKS